MAGLEGGPGAEPLDAGEFSKICKKIPKEKCKMQYFRLFSKNISNSIEKWNLYLFLGNLLLKLEPSEITSFSTTIFSGSGGGLNPLSPCIPHCSRSNNLLVGDFTENFLRDPSTLVSE